MTSIDYKRVNVLCAYRYSVFYCSESNMFFNQFIYACKSYYKCKKKFAYYCNDTLKYVCETNIIIKWFGKF